MVYDMIYPKDRRFIERGYMRIRVCGGIFLILFLISAVIGCGSAEHDLIIENVSVLIQSSAESQLQRPNGFFFELLHYHQQRAYLENGYALTKWVYDDGEYACVQIIKGSDLFPSEYEDIDRTIEYIESYAINMVSHDGRFISVFNGRDPMLFYVWDVEEDNLFKISSPSPIRKMQWMDDEPILCLLTEENKLYMLEAHNNHIKTVTLQTDIPDIDSQYIHLSETGVIYYDRLRVLLIENESAVKTMLDDVSEFYGIYKNTMVVKRMNNLIEAGLMQNEWKPFYSDRMNFCYPVNGRYLRFHDSENHDELWLIDLMSGEQSSYQTDGHGVEVFPNTDAILFFDSDGAPYAQKANEAALPLQLGDSKPYQNEETVIPLLMHEDGGSIFLRLFSLEEQKWLQYKMNMDSK